MDRYEAAGRAWGAALRRAALLRVELRAHLPAEYAALRAAAEVALDPARSEAEQAAAEADFDERYRTVAADFAELLHHLAQLDAADAALRALA